jgi:alpha-mannosidase
VDIVRLPVVGGDVSVHDSEGHEVESQLVPFTDEYVALRKYHVEAYLGQSPTQVPKYWLVFSVTVPPLGFTTYTISTAKKTGTIQIYIWSSGTSF